MKAVLAYNKETVRVLFEKGADVDCIDDDGNTPLLLATRYRRTEHVKLLVAGDADINKKGFCGHTPLIEAVLASNEETVRLFLENGADVHCVDVNGNTPLLLAAKSHSPAIIELLIERGAWVDTRNKDGDTALILAVTIAKSPRSFTAIFTPMVRDKTVRTLLKHGANPDSQDAQDNTALLLAITGGLNSIVRILLDHAANMHIPNSLGQTAWSLARENENIAHMLNVDPTSLDDKHGKLPSVCPPAPTNSPVIGPLEQPLPLESLPLGEPAEEMRGKDKRKRGDGMLDMDRIMAQLGTRFISEPSEETWPQKEKKKSKGSKSDIYDPNAHLDAEYTRGFLYHKT
jgi:ankyrin repeat protein